MTAVAGYVLDLDGTVYLGDRLIPGADQAVAQLRERGRRVVFLSNKPLHSRRDYAEKLSALGIPTTEDEVIHSSLVVARHLAQEAPGARVYAIGELPLQAELSRAGLVLTEDPSEVEYVIVAFDRTLTYAKLNTAFQALRKGARFYATNPDRTCPVDGGEIPDAAGGIAFLEATTGRRVEEVFGKPSLRMAAAARGVLGLPASACALVGDRLETDIGMARAAGMTAVLTLTGVTPRSAVAAASPQPDHVIEGIAELPALDVVMNKGES